MSDKMIPLKEKISYGLSDAASNLTFQMVTMYIMYFYTDVFGLSAGAVATLLLVVRILDAFVDPAVGVMIDKTHTRWGKCRPFFLWFALPYTVIVILTFTTPHLNESSKLIYAFVTYILLNILYSAINLPISAMLPSMTTNYQERTVTNVVRMFFAVGGGLAVAALTMPLVGALGKGNSQKGFSLTILIFASIAFVLFLNTFFNTRERIQVNGGKPVPFKEGVKSLKNLPWVICLISNTVGAIGATVKSQSIVYYLQYNLHKQDLVSLYMVLMVLGTFSSMAFSALLVKKWGKRNITILSSVFAVISGLLTAAAGSNIPFFFAATILYGFGSGVAAGAGFAMMADVVDYGEWRTGVRAQGLTYSASSFGSKFGMGVGGGLAALILSIGKYVPNATQAVSATNAISFNFIWFNVITSAICIVVMLFYHVDRLYPQIQADIKLKRESMNAEETVQEAGSF
jgi:sugar (Glycoside-Pentoside-Hexuronide) transporter